jgi:hypothetical protein
MMDNFMKPEGLMCQICSAAHPMTPDHGAKVSGKFGAYEIGGTGISVAPLFCAPVF